MRPHERRRPGPRPPAWLQGRAQGRSGRGAPRTTAPHYAHRAGNRSPAPAARTTRAARDRTKSEDSYALALQGGEIAHRETAGPGVESRKPLAQPIGDMHETDRKLVAGGKHG